jgi:hypothetical protein
MFRHDLRAKSSLRVRRGGGHMCLNAAGRLAATLWGDMSVRSSEIDLDAFVIMLNHKH